MYLVGCLPYYIFTYLTEGSFDAFMFAGIERKARFIEQALAGEITARTVEDVSDVVLSAAEIKAIASGNPQIVRKVQLEAEVARLERVRAVWLDTRRNLQSERCFTKEELHRVEGRCTQWTQAEAIVAEHLREPFSAQIATGVGSEAFEAFTSRSEAGAAVRRLVHDYQSAAAFQRNRLRGVVARYRGLELVVQAHAVFAADEEVSTQPEQTSASGPEAGAPKPITPSDAELMEQLLALAHEDGAEDEWSIPLPVIPPATASLALMAAIAEQEVQHASSCVSSLFTEPILAQKESQPAHGQATSAPCTGKHRPQRPASAPVEELHQLSLF